VTRDNSPARAVPHHFHHQLQLRQPRQGAALFWEVEVGQGGDRDDLVLPRQVDAEGVAGEEGARSLVDHALVGGGMPAKRVSISQRPGPLPGPLLEVLLDGEVGHTGEPVGDLHGLPPAFSRRAVEGRTKGPHPSPVSQQVNADEIGDVLVGQASLLPVEGTARLRDAYAAHAGEGVRSSTRAQPSISR
jgi:hypothetical protein